jgi:hypothetical protein
MYGGAVARLMILWRRPHHLTADEVEQWTRRKLGRLIGLEAVRHAGLTRPRSASAARPREWDWMLEVHRAQWADEEGFVEGDACAEWLGDLRLLGMRPSIIVAGDEIVLGPEGS